VTHVKKVVTGITVLQFWYSIFNRNFLFPLICDSLTGQVIKLVHHEMNFECQRDFE
jgi:hypothetical protein